MRKYGLILLVIFTSPWIWKIFATNWWIGLLVVITTLALYLSVNKIKRSYVIFWVLLIILIGMQISGTRNYSPQYMTNTEEDLWNSRRAELAKIQPVLGKVLASKQSFVIYKIQENFFRGLDPNEYFFAGHPRERSGFAEFEKFNFLLLPLLLIGLYWVIRDKMWNLLLVLTVLLVMIAIVGSDNMLGTYSMYPVLAVTITLGIKKVFVKK